jgi:DNA polymerase III sliding clamp (beta) subunit (PCNA family)
MKREELMTKLDLLKASLSTSDIIPSLQYFYFDTDNIVAYNGTQVAKINYQTGMDCLLPGSMLLDVLKSFSSDTVSFDCKKDSVLIKSGSSRAKLNSLPKDSFISFDLDSSKTLEIPLTLDFIVGLEKCLVSLVDNIGITSMSGITLDVSPKFSALYSTDDSTISEYVLSDFSTKEFIKILLPKLFCEQIIIWFREFGGGMLVLGNNEIRVGFSAGEIYTRISKEVEFVNFKKILSQFSDLKFVDVPENLDSILTRSLLFTSSEIIRGVKVEVNDNNLDFMSKGKYGYNRDSSSIGSNFGDLEFNMDSKLIKRALPLIKEFSLVNKDEMSIVFIGRDDNFIHLISSFSKE